MTRLEGKERAAVDCCRPVVLHVCPSAYQAILGICEWLYTSIKMPSPHIDTSTVYRSWESAFGI